MALSGNTIAPANSYFLSGSTNIPLNNSRKLFAVFSSSSDITVTSDGDTVTVPAGTFQNFLPAPRGAITVTSTNGVALEG